MKLALILVLLLGLVVAVMYLFPQINFRSMPDGLIDGNLPQEKPNWVSSFVARDNPHYVAPLNIKSFSHLSACIAAKFPEVTIQKSDASSLIAYRRSQIFHFVDWFYIHADGKVTSSATMGHSDFGKNRELVEKIRALC